MRFVLYLGDRVINVDRRRILPYSLKTSACFEDTQSGFCNCQILWQRSHHRNRLYPRTTPLKLPLVLEDIWMLTCLVDVTKCIRLIIRPMSP